MAGDRHERVPLLAVEPELARWIPADDLSLADRHLTVGVLHLSDGPVPADLREPDLSRPLGLIILDGLMLREAVVMDRAAVQLLGPGDLVVTEAGDGLLLPRTVSLTCAGGCRLGVLDEQVLLAVRRWPGIAAHLVRRAGEQVERLSVQHAIGQLPRVHDRILATFWHLAERHGRVTPSGVHLPVTLTHRLLGLLVGARRPTVSLALAELERDGAIERRGDRTWMIVATPPELRPPTWLPGNAHGVEAPAVSPRPDEPRRSPWDLEARKELSSTLDRLRRAHDETARHLEERSRRYEAIRTMAAGARSRAEATRRRHHAPGAA